jgi:hypothetical protein
VASSLDQILLTNQNYSFGMKFLLFLLAFLAVAWAKDTGVDTTRPNSLESAPEIILIESKKPREMGAIPEELAPAKKE